MSDFSFTIEVHDGVRVIVESLGGTRPATDEECLMWDALHPATTGVTTESPLEGAFVHWYKNDFVPPKQVGNFDRYIARQAWYAALKLGKITYPCVDAQPLGYLDPTKVVHTSGVPSCNVTLFRRPSKSHVPVYCVNKIKERSKFEFDTGNIRLNQLLADTCYLTLNGTIEDAIIWDDSLQDFLKPL